MTRLSLSMIVKNEEKYLRDCLESVKGAVDEVVIVDTGSTDKTIDIAWEYGAVVHHFKWINDFSAARNFSLSKCSGDWILYLDADERLNKESVNELKKTISSNKNLGVYINIYNVDDINKKPKLMKYTRLFKNSPGIKFTGRAHEQIEDSLLKRGYSLVDSKIIITHIGYNLERGGLIAKAERNLELLLTDYKSSKSFYTAFQLGNTYSIIDDKSKAAEYYSEAMKDPKLSKEYYGICAAYVADFYLKINKLEDSLKVLEKGIVKSPDHPLLNLVGSEILFKAGDAANALELCKKAYVLNNRLAEQKSGNSALDVIIEKEKILYHGLNISVQKSLNEGIQYFLGEMQANFDKTEFSFEDEMNIITMLAGNERIDESGIRMFSLLSSDSNMDFYLSLIANYNQVEIKIRLLKELCSKFNKNILVWNKLGLAYSKAGEPEKAVEVFENLLQKFPSDPSPVFYLISLYIDSKRYPEVRNLISESKNKFATNIVFNERLKEVERKIETILPKG